MGAPGMAMGPSSVSTSIMKKVLQGLGFEQEVTRGERTVGTVCGWHRVGLNVYFSAQVMGVC